MKIWGLFKNEHGAEGEANQRGAYWVVREHWAASVTKPGEVFQQPRFEGVSKMSDIRERKRELVARHYARMSAARKMKLPVKMNEVTRKLQEGVRATCKTR